MNRDINLLSHLPLYVQQYREIRNIMNSLEPELQLISDETEIILNNQFITTCNETGISRFEKMLLIAPNKGETLEERIYRVLQIWLDYIPYTWRRLLQKLDAICGVLEYEITPYFNDYYFELTTHLKSEWKLLEIRKILKYMIPANLGVIYKNTVKVFVDSDLYVGGLVVRNKIIEVETCRDVFVKSVIHSGGAIIDTEIIEVGTNRGELINATLKVGGLTVKNKIVNVGTDKYINVCADFKSGGVAVRNKIINVKTDKNRVLKASFKTGGVAVKNKTIQIDKGDL